MHKKSIEDIEGAWHNIKLETGLVKRCLIARKKPINSLTNLELATLINQKIGISLIIDEARARIDNSIDDDSELFDGQLREAVIKCTDK